MFFRKLDAHNVYVDLGYFVFGHRLDVVFDRLLYLESDVGHVVSVIDRNGDLGDDTVFFEIQFEPPFLLAGRATPSTSATASCTMPLTIPEL